MSSFTVGGIPVEVGTDEDAESAEMMVCVRAEDVQVEQFTDNVRAECTLCGAAVVHRPHAPKRPAKVCMRCALPHIAHSAQQGDLHVTSSPAQREELRRVLPGLVRGLDPDA